MFSLTQMRGLALDILLPTCRSDTDQKPPLRAALNTMKAITTTAITITTRIRPVESAPCVPVPAYWREQRQLGNDAGQNDQQIPLPMPREVIAPEPHQNMVPPVSVTVVEMRKTARAR